MKFEKRTKRLKSRSGLRGALALGLALVAAAAPVGAQNRVLPTDLTNIAAASNGGRVLSSTSVLDNDPKFDAKTLIDGQVYDGARNSGSSGWASNKFDPVNMESVTLGFTDNAVKRIGKIVLNPTVAVAPERWAKDIEVQVSTQTAEGPYQAVAQLTLRKAAERQEFVILPASARFVRLVFRSNWGSDRAVSLGEVEMYEAIDTNDPIGQLIVRLEGSINDLKRYQQVQKQSGNSGGTPVTTEEARPQPASQGADALAPATLQLIQLVTGDAATQVAINNLNIAAAKNGGKIVDVSSIFDNDQAYGPQTLLDGQVFLPTDPKSSNGWASQGFSPGKQFVSIGFKDDRTKLIGKIVVNPASNQSGLRWVRRINVQVSGGSAKDGPWRTVATLNVRNEAVNQEFVLRPVEAKYLRFVFMANGPGDVSLPGLDPEVNSDRAVSLGEIEVYEAKDDKGVLDAIIGKFNQVLIDLKRMRSQNKSAGTPDGEATTAPATLPAQPPADSGKIASTQAPRSAPGA